MAYAFNKITDYLRGGKAGTTTAPGTPGGSQPKSAPMMAGGTGANKSNTAAGGVVGTGRAILEANPNYRGEAVGSRILAPAQQQAASQVAGQGAAAQQFVGGEQAKIAETYKAPENLSELVSGAAKGDQSNTSKLVEFLNPKAYQAGTYQAAPVAPVSAAEYGRSGNVGAFLAGQAGGRRYTPGMGVLDQLAFQRGGGARNLSSQLGGINQQISDAQRAGQATAGGVDFAKLAETAAGSTKDAVTKAIQAKQDELKRIIDEGFGTATAGSVYDSVGSREKAYQDLSGIYGNLVKSTDTDEFRNTLLGVDPSQYVKESAIPTSQYNPEELGQYNALAALLNQTGLQPLDYGGGSIYTADVAGYNNALQALINKMSETQDVTPGVNAPAGDEAPTVLDRLGGEAATYDPTTVSGMEKLIAPIPGYQTPTGPTAPENDAYAAMEQAPQGTGTEAGGTTPPPAFSAPANVSQGVTNVLTEPAQNTVDAITGEVRQTDPTSTQTAANILTGGASAAGAPLIDPYIGKGGTGGGEPTNIGSGAPGGTVNVAPISIGK